jgi:uncharacterized protein involved in exopolysaccharide biosynthesis
MAEAEFDIQGVLRALWRRKLVVLLLAVVVPAAALAYSLSRPREYEATATILFQTPSLPTRQQAPGIPAQATDTDPARQEATDVALASLSSVANTAANQLGRPIGKVSVTGNASTDLLFVHAIESRPTFAAQVANVYASAYVRFRGERYAAMVDAARTQVEQAYDALPGGDRATSRGQALARTSATLDALAKLQLARTSVVQRATVPTTPSSRKTLRNLGVGLAAGLLLGLALAAVLELLQGRPHESDRDDPGSEQDRLEREFSLAGSDGTDGASSERAGHTLVAQETHEE